MCIFSCVLTSHDGIEMDLGPVQQVLDSPKCEKYRDSAIAWKDSLDFCDKMTVQGEVTFSLFWNFESLREARALGVAL